MRTRGYSSIGHEVTTPLTTPDADITDTGTQTSTVDPDAGTGD